MPLQPQLKRPRISLIAGWVVICAFCNCLGWLLSALYELNAAGYAVSFVLGAAAFIVWKRKTGATFPQVRFATICSRFSRGFPRAFLILAVLEILGGILYPPTNYDALAYRIPRILHWLAEGHWHWIHSMLERINNRSCGIEWVSAPVVALLKTDRLLFLINSVSFLFLPGLVFGLFTRLGVRRRVAWHWMWIVPTGYGLLLQAGSIGNDLFGAPFALAAVYFALRAQERSSRGDFYVSILAAAMMTSAKTSNLPLLLPWAIAILPSWKMVFRPTAVFVCIAAIFTSALPTMYFNQTISGDWSGAKLNAKPNVSHPAVVRTGANIVLLTIENLVPPVFPPTDKWNALVQRTIPSQLQADLLEVMEAPGARFELPQMQIEECGGLGFGVSVLVLVSFCAALLLRKRGSSAEQQLRPTAPGRPAAPWRAIVRWSSLISFAAVITQSNLGGIARILTPYYALLIPIVLAHGGHERVIRKLWWRVLVMVAFLMAGMLILISPARPLYPVQTVAKALSSHAPESKLVARMNKVYTVYRDRNDGFAPVRELLPPGLRVLGLTTYDDPETSLWRPFGSRRIVHVCAGDTPDYLKSRGVEYILVRGEMFNHRWFSEPLDEWLKKMNAQVVQKTPLNLRASAGPLDWYLIKLN